MTPPASNKTRIQESFFDAGQVGGLIRPARSGKTKRAAPFSIRFTEAERMRLISAAGNLTLGAYIKQRLFDDLPAVPRQNSLLKVDQQALGKVLAIVGQSRLASNMNQIAKAANLGTLPVVPETEEEIKQACYDIAIMRMLIMKALGKSKGSAP